MLFISDATKPGVAAPAEIVAVVGTVPAICAARALRFVEPRATAENAPPTGRWPLGIAAGTVFIIVFAIPVTAQFPHIARHVVKPHLVCFILAYRMRFVTGIVPIPASFIYIAATAVRVSSAVVAASGRILPFGLSGKAVAVC